MTEPSWAHNGGMTPSPQPGPHSPSPSTSDASPVPDAGPGGGCGCGSSRRAFLERGALLGAAGLATVGLAGCTDELRNQQDAPSHHMGGTPTQALHADELPVGSSASVEVEGRTLLLRREAQDVVHAFSAVCTHQGCTVVPATEDGQDVFACPCHGSHFEVGTGMPFAGPAKKPLTEFSAAVDGDWVTVTL
jgi:cytochrome b6-f complex iron-sulfur subunit